VSIGIASIGNLWVNLLIGLLISIILTFYSLKFKLLTTSGIVAASILAIVIFGFGSWKWMIPISVFFVLSSILSIIRQKKNKDVEIYFDKSSQRDKWQVLANGGLSIPLVTLHYFNPSELLYYLYISIIASVTADTWATEVGTLQKNKTFSIINFHKVEQGTSGGISLMGLAGAALGAFTIALSSLIWILPGFYGVILIIVVTGFLCSLIDSLLSAKLQAQYKCLICNRIIEKKNHCGNSTHLFRGFHWINNDAVNFFTGISGGVISFVLLKSVLG
jgi:uncharacterized protein (TIGR00297 family)